MGLPASKKVKVKDLLSMPLNEVELLEQGFEVQFEDKTIYLNNREIYINRFLWEVIILFQRKTGYLIPITTKHSITNYYKAGFFTGDCISSVHSAIKKDYIEQYYLTKDDRTDLVDIWELEHEIIDSIYNDIVLENPKYITSLDIFDFLTVQFDPRMIAMLRKVNEINYKSTKVTNQYVNSIIDEGMKTADKVLFDPKYDDNKFAQGYRGGLFKVNQARQAIASRGYVPALNKRIIGKPIAASYVSGMYRMDELMIETRSAAKAAAQSHETIKQTEYLARRLQLVCGNVERIVNGDCGTKEYTEVSITDGSKDENGNPTINMFPLVEGSWFFDDETNTLQVITSDRKDIIGKKIKLRLPHNCKHHDERGVCLRCFGLIGYNLPNHTHIGHLAATVITAQLTQSSLSAKHLMLSSVTINALYSGETINDFKPKSTNANEIQMVKRTIPINVTGTIVEPENIYNKYICIAPKNACVFPELKNCKSVAGYIPSKESRIDDCHLVFEDKNGKQLHSYPIEISKDKVKPYFSLEFLDYVKTYGYTVDQETGYYRVDLKNWKYSKSIFNIPDVEDSILSLAMKLNAIITGSDSSIKPFIKSGNLDVNTFFFRLHNEINTHLSVPLAYISVVAYGFTVYNAKTNDYRLGRNSPHATVLSVNDKIANSSVGLMCAYERHNTNLNRPNVYSDKRLTPNHIMDFALYPNEYLESYKKRPIQMYIRKKE